MKIIQTVIITKEIAIPKDIEETIIRKAQMRTIVDKEFSLLRWHEQLEIIYKELYGDLYDEENVENWYIEV